MKNFNDPNYSNHPTQEDIARLLREADGYERRAAGETEAAVAAMLRDRAEDCRRMAAC